MLDGWKAISDELRRISGGIERTRFTLWRWSLVRLDPLPVRRVSKVKGRVVADSNELLDWWQRHRSTY